MNLRVKKLHDDAVVPSRGSKYASGLDLSALRGYVIAPGQTVKVETGIVFEIPLGFEIQVRPRSGMSMKTDVRVANSPGTVDSDYFGDCSVLLHNTGDGFYEVKKGDKIAQAVLCPVVLPEVIVVKELSQKGDRGTGGFGSTGV